MASKRRRDVSTADTRLIEIYEDLANENEDIRLKAAHTLLSEFARPASSSQQKIRTILQRLFRGLCSSRKAARIGFSVALTEFLAQIFRFPAEERGLSQIDILGILDKDTISGGNTSGQVCTLMTIE
jgi:DNA polymerase phi